MPNSRENHARNFRENSAVPMTATYNEAVWDVLARTYGPLKYAEKLLARDAGATPKAARNWLDRQCAPNGEKLATLMASNDAVADGFLRLVEERRQARAGEIDRVRNRITEARRHE